MTKQTNSTLELPEFDLTFCKLNWAHMIKVTKELDLNIIPEGVNDILKKLYDGETSLDKLGKQLFKKKNHILIKEASDLIGELVQSFYRLRLSIRLIAQLDDTTRLDKIEKISYFKENFYSEYSLFTGRVWRYLRTLKNDDDVKEYKQLLIKMADEYLEVFKDYNDTRNEHMHSKRSQDKAFQKTIIIDIASKYQAEENFPKFDEEFQKVKNSYINTMIEDLKYLHDNTEITLNVYTNSVYMKIINKIY